MQDSVSWVPLKHATGATFVVVAAISLLVETLIITIIDPCLCRSIIGRSRSYHGFDIGSLLLLCLAVVIRVIEDDYLAVTRWPEDVAVEIAKKTFWQVPHREKYQQ
jgi:hypothetical protein